MADDQQEPQSLRDKLLSQLEEEATEESESDHTPHPQLDTSAMDGYLRSIFGKREGKED